MEELKSKREFSVKFIERQRNAAFTFRQQQVPDGEDRVQYTVRYTCRHHHPFLPLGLMVFGATRETWLHQVKVGNMIVCPANVDGAIPAEFYASGIPLSDLGELIEHLESGASSMLPIDARVERALRQGTPKRAWVDWGLIMPGLDLEFLVQGPFDTAVCWGTELYLSEEGREELSGHGYRL